MIESASVRGRSISVLRAIDRFSLVLAVVGGGLLAILALQIAADVFSRNIFGTPIPGTHDLTSAVWMPSAISLGLAYALRVGEHIRVDLLMTKIPLRTEKLIETLSMTATLLAVGVLLLFTAQEAVEMTQVNAHGLSARWLPIWPVSWIVVLGLFAFTIQAAAQLWRAARATTVNGMDARSDVVNEEA